MNRPRSRPAAALAGTVAALALTPAATAAIRVTYVDTSAYPNIRVSVVTPTSAGPAPRLTEDGSPVQGFVARRLEGKSIVVAIDRSTSMRGTPLKRAAAAADTFVQSKPNDDRIAVISFGATALQLTRFETSTIDADGALRGLAADTQEGTALYDTVVLASQLLEAESTQARILVLLTDGRDVSSAATLDRAVAAARAAGVTVYTIGITSPQFDPAALERLAGRTGGTYYAGSTSGLAAVYSRIAGELQRTWQLQYVTAKRPGDRLRLAVVVPSEGRAGATVRLPGGTTSPGSGGNGWVGATILGLIGGLLVFVGLRFWQRVAERNRLQKRLDVYAADRQSGRERLFEGATWRRRLGPLFAATERLGRHLRIWRTLEGRLIQADVPLRTVEFVWIMAAAGVLLALIAAIGGVAPPILLPFFVVGALIPYAVVSVKATRRLAEFERQLPNALTTLASSLSAGHSFTQAIQALVETGTPPIDAEFRRVLAETRLGRRMDTALKDMAERVRSKDLDFVIRAVIVQREIGGSLAGLFELVSDTVEKRQQFRLRVKSLTAMGRLSAVVLAGLPILVGLAIAAINANYMAPLFHTNAGHVLLGLGSGGIVVGSLILRRMVAFKT